LNFNNTNDRKLVPLRVIDLSLDVETTVLNLVGTFCPEAKVVAEPAIIVLSIMRIAIDDSYLDIMGEIEKINWKNPWSGLNFLGALAKGVLDGSVDFLTGGLRRQMESYEKRVRSDKNLLNNLKKPEKYFKIVGEKEGNGETTDFTSGSVSSFAGYITFVLIDNNLATLEIGDVSGEHETIRKSFRVSPDLKNIVLGLGESRDFTYKHETAKLWFVIPIKSYDLICRAKINEKSAYGSYYGNSKVNVFLLLRNHESMRLKNKRNAGFSSLNLKFAMSNYHYNLFGRGGADTFYFGPQLSRATGGKGSDDYIFQSDSGKAIFDYFAEDGESDMMFINVPFNSIRCRHTNKDLDVTHGFSHHIRIKDWFSGGNAKYHRHLSFRSREVVIFSQ
jgi:hypothetical protein